MGYLPAVYFSSYFLMFSNHLKSVRHVLSAIEVGRTLFALNVQHPEISSPLGAALPALLVDAWLFFFGLVMLLAEDLSFAGDFRRGLTRRHESKM